MSSVLETAIPRAQIALVLRAFADFLVAIVPLSTGRVAIFTANS